MFSSGVSTNSGSLYPDRSILQKQLEPECSDNYLESSYESPVLKEKVSLWSQAYEDIPRLSNLIIRTETIYKKDSTGSLAGDSQTTENVVDKLLEHFNHNQTFTSGICNLAQQRLVHEVRDAISKKKGYSDGEGNNSYVFSACEQFTAVESDAKTFKFVQEQLYQIVPVGSNTDRIPYMKVKTIVSGKVGDLSNRNIEKLAFRVTYTKEYENKEEARKADYLGTWAAGLSDRHSYINAQNQA